MQWADAASSYLKERGSKASRFIQLWKMKIG